MRLGELERKKHSLKISTLLQLRDGMVNAELRIATSCDSAIEEMRLRNALESLARDRKNAEAEFMTRRREREIVENALSRRANVYRSEVNRREQANVDEEVLRQHVARHEKVNR